MGSYVLGSLTAPDDQSLCDDSCYYACDPKASSGRTACHLPSDSQASDHKPWCKDGGARACTGSTPEAGCVGYDFYTAYTNARG